jgi:hypothetical protein
VDFLKLQIDILKTKQELAQKIDTMNRRLDSINQLQSVRGGTVGESLISPSLPVLSDGRSDYSDFQSCAGASITTYRTVDMFIIANHVAETPIVALGMSIIPDGSIIPGRAVGTPIES